MEVLQRVLTEAAVIQAGVDALPTVRLTSVHARDIKAQMPELSAAIRTALTTKDTSLFMSRYREFGDAVGMLQDGGGLPNGVGGLALEAAYAKARAVELAITTWRVIKPVFEMMGDPKLDATSAQEARASHSWSASPETTLAFV